MKEGWPPFPFHWESRSKWNMAALQDIACHLKEKTSQRRQSSSSGYHGESTDMEKQIFQHITDLEQQVFELEDALQALLQIIDDNRPSQRARRAVTWIQSKINALWQKVEQSVAYRILAAAGVLGTPYLIVKFVVLRLWTR